MQIKTIPTEKAKTKNNEVWWRMCSDWTVRDSANGHNHFRGEEKLAVSAKAKFIPTYAHFWGI